MANVRKEKIMRDSNHCKPKFKDKKPIQTGNVHLCKGESERERERENLIAEIK